MDYSQRSLRASFLLLPQANHWHRARVGITLQQFNEMNARVNGRKTRSSEKPGANPLSRIIKHKVILGIDPSLRGTGFGVIDVTRPQAIALAQGTISCPKEWPHSRCLAHISVTLRDVLKKFQPTICAVEGLFFAQNLKTAIIMGEARGAALAAVGEAGLEIYEIAPRKVKQAIVGYGAAQKIAVAKMVQRLLGLDELPAPDAADALALALVQAQTQSRSRFAIGSAAKQV